MNIVLAENIRMVCMFYDLSSVFDEMSMLKHYIATKKIQVDIESEPIDFQYLLEIYRDVLHEVKGDSLECSQH